MSLKPSLVALVAGCLVSIVAALLTPYVMLIPPPISAFSLAESVGALNLAYVLWGGFVVYGVGAGVPFAIVLVALILKLGLSIPVAVIFEFVGFLGSWYILLPLGLGLSVREFNPNPWEHPLELSLFLAISLVAIWQRLRVSAKA